MEEFFNSLLGAEFHKIAGIAGILLLTIGIIPNRLTVGPVSIPKRDVVGRYVSMVIGTVFVLIPLLGITFNTTIGFISPDEENSIKAVPSPSTSGLYFVKPAYASDNKFRLKIIQRSVLNIGNAVNQPDVYIYVGDIKLRQPFTLAIYSTGGNNGIIKAGEELGVTDISNRLSGERLFLVERAEQGKNYPFEVNNQKYNLKVDLALWNLFSADLVELTLSSG